MATGATPGEIILLSCSARFNPKTARVCPAARLSWLPTGREGSFKQVCLSGASGRQCPHSSCLVGVHKACARVSCHRGLSMKVHAVAVRSCTWDRCVNQVISSRLRPFRLQLTLSRRDVNLQLILATNSFIFLMLHVWGKRFESPIYTCWFNLNVIIFYRLQWYRIDISPVLSERALVNYLAKYKAKSETQSEDMTDKIRLWKHYSMM